jgi:uncharacterized protein
MYTKKIVFKTNKKNIELICEVAKTFAEKANGLMYREKLEKNKGMLFSFVIPWYRFFWMKNVKIPLDIIFVNRKKMILKIHEAPIEKGFFYKMYSSHGFCKHVIETNRGFCKENNIVKNSYVDIL